MDIQCNGTNLCVRGIPDTAKQVRLFANGIPCWNGKLEGCTAVSNALTIPLEDLAVVEGSTAFPSTALVTACALDEDRNPMERCSLPDCTLNISTGRSGNGLGEGWVTFRRLLAASLQRPGETHGWHFRLQDAFGTQQVDSDTPVLQIYLKLSFDASAPLLASADVKVTWSCRTDPSLPPSSKRPRPLSPAAWGDQSSVTHITGGCYDSVFLCVVPRESLDGDVRCSVQWTSGGGSGSIGDPYSTSAPPLRYAIHGHVVKDIRIPAPLLLATTNASESNSPIVSSVTTSIPANPQANPTPPVGKRRALLVGVSKYSRRRGNDLEWCDGARTGHMSYICTFNIGFFLFLWYILL